MTEPDRSFCVVALERVDHLGRHLGHVRRVFYRCEALPADRDTLWGDQGIWQDDERWASDTDLGRRFFSMCEDELFLIEEAIEVAHLVCERLPALRAVTVQRIERRSLEGEVPVRMVTSPNDTVTHLDLSTWQDQLGFRVGGFAEFGPWIRRGRLCPVGWFGWACGGDMNNREGESEYNRPRPLGTVVWPPSDNDGESHDPSPSVDHGTLRDRNDVERSEAPARGL